MNELNLRAVEAMARRAEIDLGLRFSKTRQASLRRSAWSRMNDSIFSAHFVCQRCIKTRHVSLKAVVTRKSVAEELHFKLKRYSKFILAFDLYYA